ncbi:MAG: glycosyltransferase family 2 protein [Campylobacterales bacterium]|nr:glycosyltransferase family 2 protein [Campylobacterales bacterium]
MNKQILVSIAMCTYNGERYLKEQLDSILNQSYKNIEIIICDDKSTDNTIEIIKNYLNKFDNIKLFENKDNLGFVKNFEKVISLCKGEYISLCDQDDIWNLNKIDIFLNNIDDNLLIYTDAKLINGQGKELNEFLLKGKKNCVKGKCNKSLLFDNCISGNTLMFKKDLLEHILPIPLNVDFHDKWIAFIASTYGSIVYYDKALISYRRYDEQVTAVKKKKYKSLKEKIEYKEIRYLKNKKNNLDILKEYEKIPGLDYEVKEIITAYKNSFNKKYFSFELFKVLNKYKEEIFKINKKNKVYSNSCGVNIQKLFLFSL